MLSAFGIVLIFVLWAASVVLRRAGSALVRSSIRSNTKDFRSHYLRGKRLLWWAELTGWVCVAVAAGLALFFVIKLVLVFWL